jgi:hypothetical protein
MWLAPGALSPFESSYTGGVYVVAGDVNGDGIADVIVSPDEGGGPRVVVYQGGTPGATNTFTQIASFFGSTTRTSAAAFASRLPTSITTACPI